LKNTILSNRKYKIKILGKIRKMKNYNRKYWNITEETTNKILNLNNEYKEKLENKKIVYGEIIEIAINNLIYDLKYYSFGDIKNQCKY